MSVACLLLLVQAVGTPAQVSDFETQALAARQAIRSVDLEFTSEYVRSRKVGGPLDDRRTNRVHVWWINDRCRVDRTRDSGDVRRESSIWTPGRFVDWAEDYVGKGRLVLSIREYDPNDPPLDPRKLGIVCSDSFNLCMQPLDNYVTNAMRESTEETDVQLEGKPCRLITISTPNAVVRKMWFSKDEGGSLVKITVEKDANYRMAMEVAVSQDPATSIWFPKQVKFERIEAGTLRTGEEVRVNAVTFNQPIADRVFTIAGMNVPVGWPVYDQIDGTGEQLAWDGERVVAVQATVKQSKRGGYRRYYLVASLGLAVVAGILLWRYRGLVAERS